MFLDVYLVLDSLGSTFENLKWIKGITHVNMSLEPRGHEYHVFKVTSPHKNSSNVSNVY